MSCHIATAAPRIVPSCLWTNFDATSEPVYPFGEVALNYWLPLGLQYTALLFAVNLVSGSCTVTPEGSLDRVAIAFGDYAPDAFAVSAGECQVRPIGIDIMLTHFRVKLVGGVGSAAIYGIPR